MDLATWELLSYIVTVIGLPVALGFFIFQQRKERYNEEAAVYEQLSANYQGFLKIALENSDLKLFSETPTTDITDEQRERMIIIFSMLVSLFERAYLLLHENTMSARQKRLWQSWEDYMREWVRREDFRAALPDLLFGEDDDFQRYIRGLTNI